MTPTLGILKSVKLSYGNGREKAIEYFLSRGWEFSSETKGNYSHGEYNDYITFKAGVDAQPIGTNWDFIRATSAYLLP